MKKLVLLLLFVFGALNAQIINFPDANFKAMLVNASADYQYQIASTQTPDSQGNVTDYTVIDTNGDGEIQVSEALAIKSLVIYTGPYSEPITDITGIEFFQGLLKFECGGTQVTNLPINSLVNLQYFLCGGNHLLTTLDLSNLHNLVKAYCDYNNLSSLNVSGLTNLNTLTCEENSLTSINISDLTNLVEFRCGQNLITNLNLNGHSSLALLVCNNNQISNFDLTGLVNLQSFVCSNNLLNTIDVSPCINLFEFGCDGNQLTSLNVDNLMHLVMLGCSNNQITSLSFNNVPIMQTLSCQYNLLTSLNVSNLTNLNDLTCNNNLLTTLNLNNNVNLHNVVFMANPLESVLMKNGSFQSYPTGIETGTGPIDTAHTPLHYICVDDIYEANYWQSIFQNTIVCNDYCSFTPGGNHNSIAGTILFDANNNGCDSSDLPQPYVRVNINDGTTQGSTFNNLTGNYVFYTSSGSFVLTPDIQNPNWFTFSPTSATIAFADNNNNTTIQNFCITANGVHNDVEVILAPISSARPGFNAIYEITYKNNGNQMLSGNVNLSYNDTFLDYVSSTVNPNLQTTGNLVWNYTNLLPFETRSFFVTIHLNSPGTNIGNILNYTTTVTPLANDENPNDNAFVYNQTVVGSFDPNNIACLEGIVVPPSEIGSYLHYDVNFENTGTYQAENIVVKVVIDTTKYDINSLQMLNTSHPAYIKITGNVAEFIFKNIMLGPGVYGNVLFKIKTLSSLSTGDMVTKTADIFFDYNAPVNTGNASTTFQLLNVAHFSIDNSTMVSPNPTSSKININSNNTIQSVQVYDVQGRLLEMQLVNDIKTTINLSEKTTGIYFLKITSDKGSKVEKIVKE